MYKTIKRDITAEMLARYNAKCDAALNAGYLVPMPSRFEGLALKGIPVIVTERVRL
jgi:hypothetical protein